MNPKMLSSLGVVALVLSAGVANADVYINSTKAPINGVLAYGPQAQYRLTDAGPDMFLKQGPGVDTGMVSQGLGNRDFLSYRAYDVTLRYYKGWGFEFTMANQAYKTYLYMQLPQGKNASSNDDDGDGDGGDGGSGGGGGGPSVPKNYYNCITWDMFSTRSGERTQFAWFKILAGDLNVVDGAFYNGDASVDTGKSHQYQTIVSSDNLLDHDWTIYGRVQCYLKAPYAATDDHIGFNIGLYAVDTTVPAPGAAGVLGLAGVMGVRRRR